MKVKIGVMFGDPMGTPGGKAIPYHASLRVRLNRSTELKDESDKNNKVVYAIHTRAKVIKGRFGPPLRTCEFDIHFADGVDDVSSIRDYLNARGEIEKRAGWMVMKDVPGEEPGEIKFRADAFAEYYAKPEFKKHIMNLLDKHLIVSYDAKEILDQDLDPESLMDAESVQDIVMSQND